MPRLSSLDKMDLEELENDIAEAISDIWLMLHGQRTCLHHGGQS